MSVTWAHQSDIITSLLGACDVTLLPGGRWRQLTILTNQLLCVSHASYARTSTLPWRTIIIACRLLRNTIIYHFFNEQAFVFW